MVAWFTGLAVCRQVVYGLGTAICALALTLLLTGCTPPPAAGPKPNAPAQAQSKPTIPFTEVTREAGLHFQHVNGATGQFYYPETFGGGAAFLDYDRDGWLDILLVNGDYWPGHTPSGSVRPTLALYHNNHDGTFTDVTGQMGLNVSLYGMGVAVGDYDNDGYEDVYITGLDHSLLFHNEKGGRFRDVTREAGVGNEGHWGTSVAWLDYDNDGKIDLFVCNYVRWRPEEEQVCHQGDLRIYCGPLVYQADSCRLFHNLGNGRFRDVTHEAGLDKTTGKALGVAIWDLDGDHYPDILVANDLTPNYLFQNNRDGTFHDVGLDAGIAYGADGMARSGMGIDVADTKNDGKCQIFISNFAREPNSFFCQDSPFQFNDKTYETGMGEPSLQALGFGLFYFDYDNDGWKDAFVTNGHIQPDIARYEPGQSYAQEPLLFHNRGDGNFDEVHKKAGGGMLEAMVGRGAACGDYDNDGSPDILLTGINGPARLLHNTGGNGNTWLTLRLVGTKSNRDGIGAEVRVGVGGKTLRDQVRSGSSYLSSSDLRLHFGLGNAPQADWVEVHWPSGAVDRLQGIKANQILTIEEGQNPSHEGRTGGAMKGANGTMIGLLMGLLLLCAVVARGQEGPEERHQHALQFLKKTAVELSDRSLTNIPTRAAWDRQRPEIRSQLLYMLGLDPLPKRTPLKAQITGTLQRPKYRIEKIVFQSLPGLYVTGNLYIPKDEGGRMKDESNPHSSFIPHPSSFPTLLYACGHSPHPVGAKWDYQDRAIWFAEQGYVCFTLDTLEFGEVPGLHHGIHDLNMWYWLSLGYTPIGVEVWNAMRAVDYLQTRPEVDKRHIGMTGISGGGAATWYTAAVDERIAAAAPVCSTITFGSQAAHWVAAGQCDCIYYHNTFLTDFPIVGALIAPRPLLICSGKRDGDFPPDGYHEVYRRAKHIYDLYGVPAQIREVDDDTGHTDAPLYRKEARQWMNRWLKGDTAPLLAASESETPRETAENLACLSALPADAINYKIQDLFIPTASFKMPTSQETWRKRREQLVQELREKVFRWFPQEKIPFETHIGRSDGGWASRYAEYKEVLFDSEAGVPIRAQLLRPRNASAKTPLLIYVKRPGDSIYFLDLDELLPLLGRYTVLILNPRLTERSIGAFEYAEIERTASWIGRTVASMQVWDILRAVEWCMNEEKLSPASISLYGKGDMGVLALYAGLFDARVQQVVLKDPPASHWNGAALLNVLRITDIPEVAGAFAPRQLVFLREVPPGFDSTRRLYKLQGCSDHLLSAGSLPEALEIWKHERPEKPSLKAQTQDGLDISLHADGTLAGVSLDKKAIPLTSDSGGFHVTEFLTPDGTRREWGVIHGHVTQQNGALELRASLAEAGLDFTAHFQGRAGHVEVKAEVTDHTGKDRALLITFQLPLQSKSWQWWDDLERSRHMDADPSYAMDAHFGEHGDLTVSKLPFSALDSDTLGLSLAVPMHTPRLFRLFRDAQGYQVSFALGLASQVSKEKGHADFRFLLYRHDPAWGLRSAAQRYYDFFPELYTKRVKKEGSWGFFFHQGKVQNLEDFAAVFCGVTQVTLTPEETQFVQQHGLYTFKHREPWAWWHRVFLATNPNEHGPTRLARPGDPPPPPLDQELAIIAKKKQEPPEVLDGNDQIPGPVREVAAAAEHAFLYDAHDQPRRLLWHLWRAREGGFAWHSQIPLNPNPHLPSPNRADLARKYQFQNMALWDDPHALHVNGVSFDSLTEWTGFPLEDYRRENFKYATIPLTFAHNGRIIQIKGFEDWELVKTWSDEIHAKGRFLMANTDIQPALFCGYYLDVMGIERSADVVTEEEMALVRTLCYRKPASYYRSVSEKGLRKCLFYGIHPGGLQVLGNPQSAEEARPLFKKYAPLIQKIAQAGWQPITHAHVLKAEGGPSGTALKIERFGDKDQGVFFTVRNPGTTPATAEVAIDLAALGWRDTSSLHVVEIVEGRATTQQVVGNTLRTTVRIEEGETLTLALRDTK